MKTFDCSHRFTTEKAIKLAIVCVLLLLCSTSFRRVFTSTVLLCKRIRDNCCEGDVKTLVSHLPSFTRVLWKLFVYAIKVVVNVLLWLEQICIVFSELQIVNNGSLMSKINWKFRQHWSSGDLAMISEDCVCLINVKMRQKKVKPRKFW